MSPSHGRVLIYVWAIEQDELSKRKIPVDEGPNTQTGKDVVVPWVLSKQLAPKSPISEEPQVYNRYYHMFAKGELGGLVVEAARSIGLQVGSKPNGGSDLMGVDIVQNGWERSNYYVELTRWYM